MWDAFTDLCDSGVQLKVSNVFRLRPATSAKERYTHHSLASIHGDASLPARVGTSETTSAGRIGGRTWKPQPALGVSLPSKRKQRTALDINMPEGGGLRADTGHKENTGSAFSLMSQRRSARLNSATSSAIVTDRSIRESTVKGDAFKHLEKQRAMLHPVSRKASLLNQRVNSIQSSVTTTGRDSKSTMIPTSTSRRVDTDHAGPELPPAATDQGGLQMLIQLLLKLGTAYYNLRRFQPQACLDALVTLPAEQQATAWVISKTARSQYEQLSYKDARSTFRVLRKIAPTWMEDLEIYSTVLWHLNDDISLAFHAHELTDSHFLSPETWCAMGNSFSLQKAYGDAIKCFHRATQLQPQLPQSYSLLGHAHLDAEQYDEASTAFRRGLEVDRRHYSAWIGLGRVQEKLGRLEMALKHYQNAEKINSTNGIILTHVARVMHYFIAFCLFVVSI
jgi:anaphase-promoting complex subunit 3